MYSQHITDGGIESFERYITRPEPALLRKPSFSLQLYEFDRLIALHHRLFGRKRVLVLPYKMLASDPQQFVNRTARFCRHPLVELGCVRPANGRRALLMQHVQRPLNFLFYHNELSPGALVHVPRFHKRMTRLTNVFAALSPQWLENRLDARLRCVIDRTVGAYYAESNRRTEALTGLALSKFGYPLAPAE